MLKPIRLNSFSIRGVTSGWTVVASLLVSLISLSALANTTFSNIADDPITGLNSYQRAPSLRHTSYQSFLQNSLVQPFQVNDIVNTPMRHRGIPGVAVFDFDNDGDLDAYVTNGPGAANSLFSNQLIEKGLTQFIDVASTMKITARNQDSNGVCYGDIDNDGDHDVLVVGHDSPSKLFRNDGSEFVDISASAGIGNGKYGMSCVMGDVNQDGKLDIFIARGYSLNTLQECFFDVFSSTIQANDLFINQGGNQFLDRSDASGIRDLVSGGMPPGLNTITWSGALVDYDQDGDLDLVTTDDQCNFPAENFGGFARGTMQLFNNDGEGNFTNKTLSAGLRLASEWMGTSWGDFNHDGHLDFFVTSFGDWGKQFVGAPIALGEETSRWYLGNEDGTFTDPSVGNLLYTPFGWGTVAEDFDNDGDTDISFVGGLDMLTIIEKSNAGVLLENDSNANFSYRASALSVNHQRRNDSGMAAGDFNNDGYVDIISVSNFNAPAPLPLVPYIVGGINYGSPFDPAFFVPIADQTPEGFIWNGISLTNGTISLELNDGNIGRPAITVKAFGTVGLTSGGINNRDGIGAVISFTPKGGKTAIKPILGGSSHASQNSLQQYFGLGDQSKGTVEVQWPGGVKNRLYGVRANANVLMPEIPCSFDSNDRFNSYFSCVVRSLKQLRKQGLIDNRQKAVLLISALIARIEYRSEQR